MRTEIRYPPEPGPNESRLEYHRRVLNAWRMQEKAILLLERGNICEREGCSSPVSDLDEGVLPRSSMLGLPLWKRRLAFASCGLFLLCAKCNREEAHQIEWAFNRACDRYGEQRVREWYFSLELKAPYHQFMPKET